MTTAQRRSNMDLLLGGISSSDDFLNPYGGAQSQPFEFESYQEPEPAPDQPWSMPSWEDFAMSPDNIRAVMHPTQTFAKYAYNNPQELAYNVFDASLEPYLSDEERALLPLRDPRRDAVSSLAVGVGDIGAAGAVKYGPAAGKAVAGHIPEFINATNRKYGIPELPFEMNIDAKGVHYSRMKNLEELDPSFHGTGARGAERSYSLNLDDDLQPTFFYLNLDEAAEVVPESTVRTLSREKYEADLTNLYDALDDPDGLYKAALDNNRTSIGAVNYGGAMPEFYRSVKDAGYTGFVGRSAIPNQGVAVKFGKTPVRKAGEKPAENLADEPPTYKELMDQETPDSLMPQSGTGAKGVMVNVGGRQVDFVQPKRAISSGEDVQMVDIDKLEELWIQDKGFHLGEGAGGKNQISNRYEVLQKKFADEGTTDMDMPELGFSGRGIPAFTDGRHRTAVLRDMGVKKVPMSMTEADAVTARELGIIDDPYMLKQQSGSEDMLALPNPEAAERTNSIFRQGRWDALMKSMKNVGKQIKSGRYVGGSPEIKSPQKRTSVVNNYISRVKDAIAAGIPKGYFYESGRQTLKSITADDEHWRLMSELMGPTSTQVGPYQNLNYAIRAHDQFKTGVPASVGLYPNNLRRSVQSALYDENPWTGYKVERYSNLLGPPDPHKDPLSMMPPNDMWEGYGTGWPNKHVPSGPAQVAFSDDIREQARRRLNDELIAAGQEPLTREEMQELHWLAIRAETEGRALEVGAKDTLQGSLPSFTFQHSWEAAPTPASGIKLGDTTLDEYSDEVINTILDEVGKDRVVTGMGGDLQLPAVRGTGVYKGDTAAGVQSQSMVAKTEAGGIDPASMARVDSTEAVRQYMLGQEGRAGHVPMQSPSVGQASMMNVNTGAVPDELQMIELDRIVNELQSPAGPNSWVAQTDRNATVFTPEGYRILDVTGMKDSGFGKAMVRKEDEIAGVAGGKLGPMKRDGIYGEYDWGGGGVTDELLGILDNPDYPNISKLADSPETRAVAGDMAQLYKRLEAEGKLTPNQKLVDVLDAWSTSGLAGVRRLVDAGLAPAVVLGVFSGLQDEPQRSRAD